MSSGSSARTVPAPTSDRLGRGAQSVGVAARRLAGDPPARPVGHRDHPVERGRDLGDDVRAPGRAVPQVGRQLLARRARPRPRRPRRPRRAAPRPPRRSRARRGPAAPTTTRDTPAATIGLDARRGAPDVGAGLERDVHGRPAGPLPRRRERLDLGVGPARRRGVALATTDRRRASTTTAPTHGLGGAIGAARCPSATAEGHIAHGVVRQSVAAAGGAQRSSRGQGVAGAEDGGPRHQDVRPSAHRDRRGRRVDAAVDLDVNAPVAPGVDLARAPRPPCPSPRPMNDCPPNPGNTVMSRSRSTSPRNGATAERRVGVRRQADAQAQVARVAQQRRRRPDLDVHGAAVGARLGEGLEVAAGLVIIRWQSKKRPL